MGVTSWRFCCNPFFFISTLVSGGDNVEALCNTFFLVSTLVNGGDNMEVLLQCVLFGINLGEWG